MSAKAIREIDGKLLLTKHIKYEKLAPNPIVSVTKSTSLQELARHNPFLMRDRLVVKPDQLIKRRGKLGLIKVNADFNGVGQWLGGMMGKEIQVGNAVGVLDHFIIEPFIAHEPSDEHYLCIRSRRNGDEILFCQDGGINVGDVDEKALRYHIPVGYTPTNKDIELAMLQALPKERRKIISGFVRALFEVYRELHFTYLEINPIVVVRDQVHILDLAAKIDATAYFDAGKKWGQIDFPPPFGREPSPEERRIQELDQGGASLKLTLINKRGRIWTMVAGGGASVIYSDTICELGGTDELANYGEYSGAPSKTQTYEYAKVILDLMTRQHHPDGKVLLIGGGIANFTNVATTFEGIVQALREYQHKLIEHKVKIYVRRGGPNYQEGLRIMKNLGMTLGVPIKVYGPETHMTAIVGMALGTRPEPEADPDFGNPLLSPFKFNSSGNGNETNGADVHAAGLGSPRVKVNVKIIPQPASDVPFQPLFTKSTKSIVFGHQPRAIQGMLDFDFCCGRTEPSVSLATL
jgi:ATP citrate (pro-S)-lyase